MVKNLPANVGDAREMSVRSLVQEDPLKREMETPSGVLVGKTPWTEEPGGLQSMGSQRVRHHWGTEHARMHARTHTHTHTEQPDHHCIIYALLLLLFSCWVVSYSLQPHELKHFRLLYSPLSLGICSNSCPLSWWCYLTVSSSAAARPPLPSIFFSIKVFSSESALLQDYSTTL